MSLMSSFLLLQQCPASLVHVIWMVWMGGEWPYSCCFVGCCFQDLFNIAYCILVQFPFSCFSIHSVSVHVVHPFSRIDTTAAWKKLRFILSERSDFHNPMQTITDAVEDIALLANIPIQTESLLHSLEQAAGGIGLHVNADRTKYMCFNQQRDISTLVVLWN